MDVLVVACYLLIVLLFTLALAGLAQAVYALPLFFVIAACQRKRH